MSKAEQWADSMEILNSQTELYEGDYDLRIRVDAEIFDLTINTPDLNFKVALEAAKGKKYTPEDDSGPIQMKREWAIVDGDNILHKGESKEEVLEWAWKHDKSPIHYELIALPKNHTGGVI